MIRESGFTLIELLIALTIAAMISMGTLFLFTTTLSSKDVVEEQSEHMAQLSRVIRVIEQDFIQLSPYRAVRDAYGDYLPAIEMNFEGLYLTRNGWATSRFMSFERSTQQRVNYRIAEPGSDLCPMLEKDEDNDLGGCLIRSYLTQLDDDGSLAWQHQKLFRPVQKIDWQFLIYDPDSNSSEFKTEPPQEDPRDGLLKTRLTAVRMSIELGTGQNYSRLFATPALPGIKDETRGVN